MVPGAETFPSQRTEKAVWQLAFYAALEETKGIKIFCDAVEQLPRTVLDRPGFEVSTSEGACSPDQGGSMTQEEVASRADACCWIMQCSARTHSARYRGFPS